MTRRSHATGYCQRSGDRVLLSELVHDGYRKNLLVTKEMRDIAHPQERPVSVVERLHLDDPAPQNDIDVASDVPGTLAANLFAGESYFGGGT